MGYVSGFFENRRGKRLFFAEEQGTLASSAALAGQPAPTWAWILCSPILEEKVVSHGVLRSFARALASDGVSAFRFDYEGDGDSEGEFSERDLRDWAQDVEDAARFLRGRGVRHIGLLGCRMGATIAAMAAPGAQADRVIAWCPILDGREHAQELLRYNLTTQLAVYKKVLQTREQLAGILEAGESVNVLGWELGARLFRALNEASFVRHVAELACPVDILIVGRSASEALAPQLQGLASRGYGVRAVTVPGTRFWVDSRIVDHAQSALTDATLGFIRVPLEEVVE